MFIIVGTSGKGAEEEEEEGGREGGRVGTTLFNIYFSEMSTSGE